VEKRQHVVDISVSALWRAIISYG